jgi:ATP-binding cassette subfamily F protein 3
MIVSHARDFLNVTCEEIIHFFNMKLAYYKGNFDTFERVRNEKMRLMKKTKEAQQNQVEHIQNFIDKFRYNAKRASLVQSRIKKIQKMDIIEEVISDPTCVFIFPNPEKISPPILRLDEAVIGYGEKKIVLDKVNINIDQETRIALVGPNGAGKSTLLKALLGMKDDVEVIHGHCFIHNRLRIGNFTQHHIDSLDLRLSALEQMMVSFPGNHSEQFRSHLGSFGISANLALRPMYLLSGGQKSRVAFAMITWTKVCTIILFINTFIYSLTYCCWMSQLIIWTSMPLTLLLLLLTITKEDWSWYLMISTSSAVFATECMSSRTRRSRYSKET